jgi:hypothetical protein
MGTDTDHLDFTVLVYLTDDASHLGGTDIQANDEIPI